MSYLLMPTKKSLTNALVNKQAWKQQFLAATRLIFLSMPNVNQTQRETMTGHV